MIRIKPTTEEILERKKENALLALEEEKPCTREILSEQAFFRKRWLIGAAIATVAVVVILVSAAGFIGFVSKDNTVWPIIGGLLGVVLGTCMLCSVTTDLEIHHNIAEFSLPRFMNAEQAAKVSAWAEKYPRIKEVCIKRGSQHPARTLTSVDYFNINLVCEQIETIEIDLAKLHKDREQAQNLLNKHGLSDLIQSAAEHRILVKATPEAKEEGKTRRI